MKRWVSLVLALEILGIVVFSAVYDSLDFRIYWLGGEAVTDGTRLYREQLADHWFTNTPFMAALFTPLAALPLTFARMLWQLAALAAFVWACTVTGKLAGRRVSLTLAVAAGLLLEPVWHSFFLGQVNLFLLALVLADMHRVALGRPAGIGIGIATSIKLTPAVFVVLLLLTRRTKDAVTAAATFAVCTLLAYAIAPDASRLYWLHTFYDTSRVGVPYISNQSPYGALTRILRGTAEVGDWYTAIPLTIGAFGLLLAAAWARRGDWLSATAVTGVTGLLVSPISWAHHWVWVVPVLAVLLRDNDRRAAVCGYILFVLSPLWWTPHNGDPRQYGLHFLTPVANCYLLAGVFFLAHMAVRLRVTSGHGERRLPEDAADASRAVRDPGWVRDG
ncbi:glycosyltransferase 87 family protein [Actinomadura madurae]|uniref:glycosyltransferase 87 family protein n=1 Tax=Actinomadura madurae TaxID=1993 RepID=UPI000D84672D|nr:glycosyltransferase 87 family protein [Actinomadura madurae]SPT59645.1 Polyprenol-phosphate-mannose-dependent alpha-(1-2)-phosphatidylinositol mannoside mannosyltransferase [Actinomadura madurae]